MKDMRGFICGVAGFVLVLVSGLSAPAQQTNMITSFLPDGRMSFSGYPAGSTVMVQWASSLTDPLRTNWNTLRFLVTTNDPMTTEWPVFFRVMTPPDTNGPVILNVSSPTPPGSYNAGDSISIQVLFNENAFVTGTPQLALAVGPARSATYVSGSGTATLTFSYTVSAGDNSADLDYTGTSALTGTIRDALTNAAPLTLPTPGAAGSLSANEALIIDTTAPTVASVTSTTPNGTYTTGAVVAIQVIFAEAVLVTGTPTLTLETGAANAVVSYTSGSGTSTLTFNYTVGAGHVAADLDYVSNSALALAGGTIRDAAGNNATLTLPAPGGPGSLGANKNIVINQ